MTITDDIHITAIKELLPPIALLEKFPATDEICETVANSRNAIHKILSQEDDRLLVIIGPCSSMIRTLRWIMQLDWHLCVRNIKIH